MANQASLGITVDLGSTGKTIVFVADTAMSVPTPKGFTILIDPVLEEQDVVVLTNGKIKFPKKGVFLVLITVDSKFKQVRVEVAEPTIMKLAVAEAFGEVDQKAIWNKITAFLASLPDDSPTGLFALKLLSIDPKPLIDFLNNIKENVADINFQDIGAELVTLAKAKKEELFPDSTEDE